MSQRLEFRTLLQIWKIWKIEDSLKIWKIWKNLPNLIIQIFQISGRGKLGQVQGKKLLLDFATVHGGEAKLLTDGPAYKEEHPCAGSTFSESYI